MDTYTYEKLLAWSRNKLRPWQQDALRRVLQGRVSDLDNLQLRDLAIAGVVGASDPKAEPADASHVRPSGELLPQVAVLGLQEIERANALGPGPIAFAASGLTVIYGDNASGKTGLSRILKRACRARVPGPSIRGNVLFPASVQPARAKIEFSVNGVDDSTDWVDGTPARDELALVTVFDAHCASWQVDRPNVIEYTPELLAVFRDLARVFGRVEVGLRYKRTGFPRRPVVIDELVGKLPAGTRARRFIEALSHASSFEELERLVSLNESEERRRVQLTEVLSVDPGAEGQKEEARRRRLLELSSRCHELHDLVSDEACDRISSRIEELAKAREAADAARAVLTSESRLEGVGAETWRMLWEAARTYSEQVAYPRETFPVLREQAECVLCQQILGTDAAHRLRSFEQFVQDAVQRRSDRAQAELDVALDLVRGMAVARRSRDLVRDVGLAEAGKAADVRQFIVSIKRRRLHLLRLTAGDERERPALVNLPDLSLEQAEIAQRVRMLNAAANADERAQLLAEHADLTGRYELAGYRDDLAGEIRRLGMVAIVDAAIAECNTQKVTLEQGVAEKSLVASRLQDRFRKNLIDVGFSEMQVDVRPQAGEQGARPYGYRVTAAPSIPAGEVLSEGERTCVALAGVLAELETTGNRSGVVLDDPVCSLDHNYRERIARHLAEESKRRQIVVFTHDVVFLFLLERYAASKGVPFQPVTLRRGGSEGGHGRAESEPPWETMTVKERLARMRRAIATARQLLKNGDAPGYEREARDVYGQLRQTWERGVEEVLLNGAILRFGQSVETQKLRKAAGDIRLEDIEKIDEEMAYCSKFMHDSPGNVSRERPPGPDVVEADIKKLDDWAREIRKRRESRPLA
jgi:hypothetical protein